MFSEYQLSVITAIGTLGATFVALFIVIIPSIWNRRKQRIISLSKIKNNLWILHELLRGYVFFNPQTVFLQPNERSYSFDVSKVKLSININEKEIIKSLYDSLTHIKKKESKKILEILNHLELIFSGLPQHNTSWISIDNELIQLRAELFNDSKISMEKSIDQIINKSTETD